MKSARRLHHLFRVAASLDSLVIGEPQILGQIKEAYELAAKVGTAGPLLGSIFPRAFRVARKVRRDTGIAEQKVSVSSVAVDLARKVWGGFEGRRVLVIGAGKMADLAARVLAREGASLAVTNRTPARAEELARRLGAQIEPWDQLAGGGGPFGHRDQLDRRARADLAQAAAGRSAAHAAPPAVGADRHRRSPRHRPVGGRAGRRLPVRYRRPAEGGRRQPGGPPPGGRTGPRR